MGEIGSRGGVKGGAPSTAALRVGWRSVALLVGRSIVAYWGGEVVS